jgi:hypothetical protein
MNGANPALLGMPPMPPMPMPTPGQAVDPKYMEKVQQQMQYHIAMMSQMGAFGGLQPWNQKGVSGPDANISLRKPSLQPVPAQGQMPSQLTTMAKEHTKA